MTNGQLIEELLKLGYIKTGRLEDAFWKILREDFVPNEAKSHAYENIPLSIGYEQTISQPLVVAFMLELLEVRVGDTILEIGTGSGWQSVLLAALSENEVVTMERIPELYESARRHMTKYPHYAEKILCIQGDGSRGYEEKAPYDKIIVGAAVQEEIPNTWKQQIKIGGRIVFPMDERIIALEKTGKNEFSQKEFFGFTFVPLVSG